MAKIPVGETIANAYSFAFKHAPTNLAVAWIPLLLPAIASQLLMHYYPLQLPPPGADPATVIRMGFGGARMLLLLFSFLCVFAQIALFTREALGLRKGSAFLQNPFGASTWRALLAMLLLIVAFIGIYIAVLVASIAGGVAIGIAARFLPDLGAYARPVFVIVILALAVAVPVVWTYVVLRLTFLVIPVAVAEEQVSLSRAWELARGNVGRIFVVWLSVVIPFLVLDVAFIWFLSQGHLFPPFHAGMKPDEIVAWQQQYSASLQSQMRAMNKYWYITVPLSIAFGTIMYGLFSAPAAFAYRALTAANAKPSTMPTDTPAEPMRPNMSA